MKWADVQQIASGASCSANVISLSLVIISRSVGWEIQIRLPKGRKRQKFLDKIQNFARCARGEDVLTRDPHVRARWATGALKQGDKVVVPPARLSDHRDGGTQSRKEKPTELSRKLILRPRRSPPVSTLTNIFILLHVPILFL